MGLAIVINCWPSCADLITQETFHTTKLMYWALVGTLRRMLRDNGSVVSVDSSAAIKMGNASRNGVLDQRAPERFATSQCLFPVVGQLRVQCHLLKLLLIRVLCVTIGVVRR